MILISLKPWQKIEGIKHVKTKWRVSDSANMENILESAESSTMLERYFSHIYIPVGATYYVEATRVFDDGSETKLDPIPSTNYGSDKSSMLLQDDVVIDTPFVYVNKEDIISNDSTLTIRTSQFRCNGDDHAFTHWIIRDSAGEILYTKLYDRINKTSITVPNAASWKEKTTLEFIAIHGSNTSIESPAGKSVISLTSSYNFEISGGISWVEPLRDYEVVFKIVDPTHDIGIFKVELLDYATEQVMDVLERNGNNFLIPWYYLKENMKYKLGIYAYDTNLIYGKVIKALHVASLSNTIIKDSSYVYSNKLEESSITGKPLNMLPNLNIHSEVLYNNKILMPNPDKTCSEWLSVEKTLTNSEVKADGILLPTDNYENMLIRPITKGLILIDMLNGLNQPVFLLYTYNNHNNTYTLQHTIVRDDETTPLGKTNSILQISSTEFIYNPVGTNKLRLFNISTNSITNLEDIPLENLTNGILIRTNNDSILIANGKDYTTKLYNYTTKAYTDGFNFGPNSFIGAELRTVVLVNGDTAIIKLSEDESSDPNMIYFDYSKNAFVEDASLVFKKGVPTLTCTCVDGHIHMAKLIPGSEDDETADVSEVKVYF